MKCLYLIPARGGSKGIPGKNIKLLADKPLIYYSIDIARAFASDDDICISTDDPQIIKVVEAYNLLIPFVRPSELATDTAGSYEVILNALEHYEKNGKYYDTIVLLQPTSPLRTINSVRDALNLYSSAIDMVVSVSNAKTNPSSIVRENSQGFLEFMNNDKATRRQDYPEAYEYNGAIYIMNVDSLKKEGINDFKRVKKYLMKDFESIDIDTPLDLYFCEFLIKNKYI